MKRNSLIIFSALLFSLIQTSVYADHCYSAGLGSFCYFDSLSSRGDNHVYFHCDTDASLFVKMFNHNVLISGFMPSGSLTLSGSEVKKMLDNYYFEVTHHEGHNGYKYVAVSSLGRINCTMGRGGRTAAFPGAFGVS